VQARLTGARIDVDTALRFAVANGLRVDWGRDSHPGSEPGR
jgi:hypothetical protein